VWSAKSTTARLNAISPAKVGSATSRSPFSGLGSIFLGCKNKTISIFPDIQIYWEIFMPYPFIRVLTLSRKTHVNSAIRKRIEGRKLQGLSHVKIYLERFFYSTAIYIFEQNP